MRHITIAVIGHVDHGKTSLVKALTGVETDTLKEEKLRGLSINLGFAHLRGDGHCVHLIDTPGHADFVRTTASGVSGADAVLLVVSAVDGIQPQTREHLRLAHLFGIRSVIVTLTKSDRADAQMIASVSEAIAALLAELDLHSAANVTCSSMTDEGIERVAQSLHHLASQPGHPPELKGVFLPIDRVFSAPGVGTIVTGTLRGRALNVEDDVTIGPGGIAARIRGLQVGGAAQQQAFPGARVAVNLRDVDRHQIDRGQVLSTPHLFEASQRFDVALPTGTELKHMDHVTLLLGAAHVAARLRLYPPTDGDGVFGQLQVSTAQTAYPGQRFVLRQPATGETVTGGTILDPNATLITRNKPAHVALLKAIQNGAPDEIAHALADRDRGVVDRSVLDRLSDGDGIAGHADFETVKTGGVFRRVEGQELEAALLAYLAAQHAVRPIAPFVSIEQARIALRPAPESLITHIINKAVDNGRVRKSATGLALSEHDPVTLMTSDQHALYQAAETRLLDMALHPAALFDHPTQDEQDIIALLIFQGRAVSLYNHSLKQSLLLHGDAIEAARVRLNSAFSNAARFTTSEARMVLETNRKTIVPLLEHFDQLGLTTRTGDVRAFAISKRD